MSDAEVRKNLGDDGIRKFIYRLRMVVEMRTRRDDDSTRMGKSKHVSKMNGIVRHLSRNDDKTAAFLEADVRGTHKQVIRNAVREFSESSHRAGDDGHSREGGTSARAGGKKFIIVYNFITNTEHPGLILIFEDFPSGIRGNRPNFVSKTF